MREFELHVRIGLSQPCLIPLTVVIQKIYDAIFVSSVS